MTHSAHLSIARKNPFTSIRKGHFFPFWGGGWNHSTAEWKITLLLPVSQEEGLLMFKGNPLKKLALEKHLVKF